MVDAPALFRCAGRCRSIKRLKVTWRVWSRRFLAAAYELRTGIPQGETGDSSSPDVIRAMSTELFLNFLGIRMDGRRSRACGSPSTW
jgi:alkyl sulfatase BDS1-like metallo-beta-lactamase superfamily hydrolase